MRTSLRVISRVFVVVLVVVIGWLGLVAGLNATSVPKLSQNRIAHSGMLVTTNHFDIAVDVEWTLNSIGQVHISVGEFDPYLNSEGTPIPDQFGNMHPSPGNAVISIKLSCDARLATLPKVSTKSYGFAGVVRGGYEDGCQPRPFTESNTKAASNPAYQVLKFKADGNFAGELTAYPVKPWTASGAGIRIARTPPVTIGPFIKQGGQGYPVSAQSIISTGVTSDDSETVDTFFPQQITNGNITYDNEQQYIGKDGLVELASLVYTADAKEFATLDNGAGSYTLSSATVKWVEPAQQQQGQLLILFSGVALGIVAAFVVELLLVVARGPRDKPSSPTRSSRKVARR
jgi:hypothetical protein